ncbi:MAG: gfo/Idh/MocA family oxidoreductase, partial [Verrucomicrobiota bacterium]|nr:gfo/Idh/MocA family oxidoreductase [Verrucomicrobiota bacterium]
KKAGSDFAYGGPLTELALLGIIGMRFPGQRLEWDSRAVRFANHPEANRWLQSAYRDGWAL